MLSVILIDDEQHCIERMQTLLHVNYTKEITILKTCSTVEEGILAIYKLKPQLIFLDIEIHNKTGFDLLREFDEIFFDVVFTTAHDKYAVQAFKFSAVDYLLKPVDAEDLKIAISKVLSNKSASDADAKMKTLLENIQPGKKKKLLIPTVTGFDIVSAENIIRLRSNVNYTTLFLNDKKEITVAKTLKEFENMLADFGFFRIHNSDIINLKYLKSYNKGKGGYVIMQDGTEIEVSSRRKDEFLQAMKFL